jgi:SAM-dependent methyltransferase
MSLRSSAHAVHRMAHQLFRSRSEAAEDGGMGMSGPLYDRLSGFMLRGLHRRVAADLDQVPAGATVVDVGTGPGWLLLAIAQRRPDIALRGVDISPRMVDRARRKLRASGNGERIDVHVGEAAQLPLPDGSADAIVSTLSMHHWGDIRAAVKEAARVLRPGGRLIVYDFRAVPHRPLQEAVTAQPEFEAETVRREVLAGGVRLPFVIFARLTVTRRTAAVPSALTAEA